MNTIIIIPAEYKQTLNRIINEEFPNPYVSNLDIFQLKLYREDNTLQDEPDFYCACQNLNEKAFIKASEIKRQFPGSVIEVFDDSIYPDYPELLIKSLGLVRKTPIMPP